MIHDLLLLNDTLSVCLPPTWAQRLLPPHPPPHHPSATQQAQKSAPCPQPLSVPGSAEPGLTASAEDLHGKSPELVCHPPFTEIQDSAKAMEGVIGGGQAGGLGSPVQGPPCSLTNFPPSAPPQGTHTRDRAFSSAPLGARWASGARVSEARSGERSLDPFSSIPLGPLGAQVGRD